VSFIHPRGHEHGLDQVADHVFRHLVHTKKAMRRFTPN
jgi:hypothetical protein